MANKVRDPKLAVALIAYLVGIHQPVHTSYLRSLFFNAASEELNFASVLREAREMKLISDDGDPLTCLERGRRLLRQDSFRFARDANRLFLLKDRLKSDTVAGTSGSVKGLERG
jgi:hypothetical protein